MLKYSYIGTDLSTEAATFDHIARWVMGYPRRRREMKGYCYVLYEELGMKIELISSNTF